MIGNNNFIYLPGNNSGIWRLKRDGYPVGMMYSPDGYRSPVRGDERLEYAVDNGLYHKFRDEPPKPSYARGLVYGALAKIEQNIDEKGWHPPLFAVVPDVPYDGSATYRELAKHSRLMREMFPRVPLALAVQDGMIPKNGAYIAKDQGLSWIFVAGSDAWKDATVPEWVAQAHRRGLKVHLARANETKRIELAKRAGCDSADGTGIWRGDMAQKGRVLRALTQELMFLGWERQGAA